MKKIWFAIGGLVFVALLSINNSSDFNSQEKIITDNSYTVDLTTLDNVVFYSENIVSGEVISNQEASQNQYKTTFKVNENIKGNIESGDIDIYSPIGTLEQGKRYILFLTSFDSSLYPRVFYTPVTYDLVIELNEEKVKDNEKYKIENKTIKEVTKIIKDSNGFKNNISKKEDSKHSLVDSNEIYEASDNVTKIRINELLGQSKEACIAKIEVIENLKGELLTDTLILPSNINLESEYTVYLVKSEDGTYTLTSRENSIVN